MTEFQEVNKDTHNEHKSNLRSLLDEKNIIVKSLIFYTMEKENPDSTMEATTIDKKIAKYNKMKNEKDNQLMIEFKYQKVNKYRLNELKSELRSLHEEKNRIAKKSASLLLATHDINYINQFCDKLILLLENGSFIIGETRDILTEENLSAAFSSKISKFSNGRSVVFYPC